ncbi:MAG: hypothetical protein ACJAVI_001606 [Candidatus Azotimanducaceae bacterium]
MLAPGANKILNQPADNIPASRRYTHPAPKQNQEERNTKLKAASADEIRNKLENRDADITNENKGASVFQSRELSNPIPKVAQKIAATSISIRKPTPKNLLEKIDKPNLAQSPEAIRAQLEARKAEKPDLTAQVPPVNPDGKAIFETK